MGKLSLSLFGGQSFTWLHIGSSYYKAIRYDSKNCIIQVHEDSNEVKAFYGEFDPQQWINTYIRHEQDIEMMYKEWKCRDSKLSYHKIHLLNQDPLETILGFICSSNNNIKRIQKMMQTLSVLYGTYITTIEKIDVFSFPTLNQLEMVQESTLRENGFGYRAKYIADSCIILKNNPEILNLHNLTYSEAKTTLLQLKGVGYKVADCILLMGFGFMDCVPIDVHIKRCIEEKYNVPVKALSPAHYDKLQLILKDKWGDYAGWAHLLAFADMRLKK